MYLNFQPPECHDCMSMYKRKHSEKQMKKYWSLSPSPPVPQSPTLHPRITMANNWTFLLKTFIKLWFDIIVFHDPHLSYPCYGFLLQFLKNFLCKTFFKIDFVENITWKKHIVHCKYWFFFRYSLFSFASQV